MPGPISPDEVEHVIPEAVFEVFNEMIKEKWDGRSATVFQDEVAPRVAKRLGVTVDTLYSKHYLDVESHYQEAGWDVEYDKPAYNEDYRARFSFKKKASRRS